MYKEASMAVNALNVNFQRLLLHRELLKIILIRLAAAFLKSSLLQGCLLMKDKYCFSKLEKGNYNGSTLSPF
ncbi:hypothetical protein J7438_22125 [Thalassotalea sp. G20_0]|uniref:hypothetical protein n=1 Tax=Thalassotalea sp. G20_0 TaxID=2821093 RepID=UPI001ADCD830|nr:hypothetical protein [Thalassotalea sp. G20_0]MBO9496761.1 hypothetical protein [Thalassotalea sp. G20_0]